MTCSHLWNRMRQYPSFILFLFFWGVSLLIDVKLPVLMKSFLKIIYAFGYNFLVFEYVHMFVFLQMFS